MKTREIKEKARAILPYLEPKCWKISLGFYIIMLVISLFSSKIARIQSGGFLGFLAGLLTVLLYGIILAVNTGFLWWAIGASRGVSAPVYEIKTAVNNLGTIFIARLAALVIALVAGCFLIIPGIYFMYSYAMVPYILHDEPDIGIRDLLEKSRKMMRGNKIKFFLFQISFIGEIIITVITLGIAGLYTAPYMYVASAMFYDGIK
jgi:hypothetical protein